GSASVAGSAGLRDRKLPAGRVAMSGGEREGEKPPPGVPPAREERRGGVRSGSSGSSSSSGSADLIAGVERRRGVLGAAQSGGGVNAAAEAPADHLDAPIGSRMAAGPPAKGPEANLPPAEPNQPQALEVGDQPKSPAGDDILLSIPFKGEVDAEASGVGALSSDGLVSHGGEVEFTDDAQLSFPAGGNVNSSAGTISFEIRPQWGGADETNNS